MHRSRLICRILTGSVKLLSKEMFGYWRRHEKPGDSPLGRSHATVVLSNVSFRLTGSSTEERSHMHFQVHFVTYPSDGIHCPSGGEANFFIETVVCVRWRALGSWHSCQEPKKMYQIQ